MPRVFHSIVVKADAATVWKKISKFDDFSWGPDAAVKIVNGDANGGVGAQREITLGDDKKLLETCVSLSHVDRFYEYIIDEPSPFPAPEYRAKLSVTPITADNTSLVIWETRFDSVGEATKGVIEMVNGLFSSSLAKLATRV